MAPRVAIFWDIETCFLPEKLTGYETVDSIRRIANSYGSVTLFKLYTEGFEGHVSLPRDIRTQLELSGVSLVECTQEANSSLLSQLPTDLLIFALDNPAPATIMLISGNLNFVYPISLLRLRGYNVVLVLPPASSTHRNFGSQAFPVLDWNVDILEPYMTEKGRQNLGHAIEEHNPPSTVMNVVLGSHNAGTSAASTSKAIASSRRSNRTGFENETAPPSTSNPVASSWRRRTSFNSPSLSQLKLTPDPESADTPNISTSGLPLPPLVEKIYDSNVLATPTPSAVYRPPVPAQTNYMSPRGFQKSIATRNTDTPPGLTLVRRMLSETVPSPSSPSVHSSVGRSSAFRDPPSKPNAYGNSGASGSFPPTEPPLHDTLPAQSTSHSNTDPSRSFPHGDGHLSTLTIQDTTDFPDDSSHQNFPTELHPPKIFLPLIEELTVLCAEGNRNPLRSLVGMRLKRATYAQAGVADFSQYVALAENMGIVELGGSGGKAWIALKSAQRQTS